MVDISGYKWLVSEKGEIIKSVTGRINVVVITTSSAALYFLLKDVTELTYLGICAVCFFALAIVLNLLFLILEKRYSYNAMIEYQSYVFELERLALYPSEEKIEVSRKSRSQKFNEMNTTSSFFSWIYDNRDWIQFTIWILGFATSLLYYIYLY